MALNIAEGTRATVWEIDNKGKYASVKMSSSRKDKRLPEGKQWVNTSWFARFVGDAFGKIDDLARGTRIELVNAYVAQEPYEVEGVKTYPKSPQVVVFDFNVLSQSEGGAPARGMDTAPVIDDNDIPF